ncbi:M15 family metallopeptidase [Nocardioides sp.]|uniref:M15 family metallopeptidase n=1 Tax=Nocardioides sp. TaxID=35761 RepID=UPI003D12F367
MGRRLILLVVVAGLASACSGSPASAPLPTASSGSPSSASASATPTMPTSAPTVDPSHAVPTPPPWSGRVLPPDLLVYAPDSLRPATIEAIRQVPGVTDVESISMAQVTVENQGLNVVAVDPATYRRFAPTNSAKLDEQWARVANGELAILPALGEKLMNADGYLQLGTATTAPLLHVGALAPQIPQVDAVINTTWGAELDMPVGNALIVATDETSPQSVRPKITKIAGEAASVQILTVNLDTSVQQTAVLVGSVGDAVGTFNYTVLTGGRIAPDPAWVTAHIRTESVPLLGDVTCNKLIFPQLRAALSEVVRAGLSDAIHPAEFAGCYYPRFIAGTTKLSNHSFGLALDLNVPGNQRGTVGEMDRTVVAIFKSWGFAWGGDWSYTDPMHFEMNALVAPG